MSDDKSAKRVNPSDDRELSDEALESVAGGCQDGCSNANTCVDGLSMVSEPGNWFKQIGSTG